MNLASIALLHSKRFAGSENTGMIPPGPKRPVRGTDQEHRVSETELRKWHAPGTQGDGGGGQQGTFQRKQRSR